MAPLRWRCCLLPTVVGFLALTSCSRFSAPPLRYTVTVTNTEPRRMTVDLDLRGRSGSHLDLRAHSPVETMRIEDLRVLDREGRLLTWTERPETVRVDGAPVRLSTYRVEGPIPDRVHVTYRVTPGRREGDSHIGFTGRCFGYLGRDYGIVTGRDVFLLPEGSDKAPAIEVAFSLPPGWRARAPWEPRRGGWVLRSELGNPAENLAASVVGMGRFQERSFTAGRTRVHLAVFEPVQDVAAAARSVDALRASITYLRHAFGRDLGADYLVLVAPQTPDGCDLAGGGWVGGQGRTLLPISTERLRRFADQYIQSYVRYAPFRAEIDRPEEFWLVDGIAGFYSRRAVARAGMGDDEAVARGLATSYTGAIMTEGVSRNLERFAMGGEADATTRETIAPYMLLQLDHELRTKYGVARGLDEILPRLFASRHAPSLWSLLPQPGSPAWKVFRNGYVRGSKFAPTPDLFGAQPTRSVPTPARGPAVSSLTIVYTGNTDGYLENCGCKANQSGGIARRGSVIDRVRARDSEALLLDAGSALNRPARYESPNALEDREQRFYLQMMDRLGYQACAIGLGELVRGPTYFQRQTAGVGMKFLAANVAWKGIPLGPSSMLLRAHGVRVGVIGVFEPSRGGKSQVLLDREICRLDMTDPIQAVTREAVALRGKADLLVVMGKVSPLLARRLAERVPDVDIILSTDSSVPLWGTGPKPKVRMIVDGDRSGFVGGTLLLYANMMQYGLSTARIGLDAERNVTNVTIADSWLTEEVPDQEQIRIALNRFYDQVGALPEAQGSVTPPLAHDPYWQGKRYAGADACRRCHPIEFAQWKDTPHASAYKTLLDKHRHYQPACVSCHVVGFGSTTGYRIGQPEHPMGNVQCEVCHGPGADHVAAPSPATIRRQVPEHVCLECHNPDHSDRFVYASKVPLVIHRPAEHVAMH